MLNTRVTTFACIRLGKVLQLKCSSMLGHCKDFTVPNFWGGKVDFSRKSAFLEYELIMPQPTFFYAANRDFPPPFCPLNPAWAWLKLSRHDKISLHFVITFLIILTLCNIPYSSFQSSIRKYTNDDGKLLHNLPSNIYSLRPKHS